MLAVVYIRVSYAEQVANMSLDVQERSCVEYCARNGWIVGKVYREEGESAKTADRPVLQKMLSEITKPASKVGVLVVYDLSRLTRDTFDHLRIRRQLDGKSIKLRAATQNIEETPEGNFVQTVLAATNMLDNEMRSRKSKAGMQEGLERGKWQWMAPLGYRHRVSEDGKSRWIEPDPDVAPLISKAFEMFASEALTVEEILRRLQERGARAARGRKLSAATLHRVLRNPFYAGRVESKRWGIYSAGQHTALVDEVTFERVRRALHNGTARPYRTPTAEHFVLRQLLIHDACGRPMSGGFSTGRGGKRFGYYVCKRCRVNVPDKVAEGELIARLDMMAAPADLAEAFRAKILKIIASEEADRGRRMDSARRSVSAADARIERISTLLIDGTLDGDDYARERARAAEDRRLAVVALEEGSVSFSDGAFALELGMQLLQRPAEMFDSLPRSSRPKFLRMMFPDGLFWNDQESEIRTGPGALLDGLFGGPAGAYVDSGTPLDRQSEPLIRRLYQLRAIIEAFPGAFR